MITAKELRRLLNYCAKTGVFRWIGYDGTGPKRNGRIAGCKDDQGYLKIKINQKKHGAHRLAYLYVYGRNPIEEIDHINGDKSDNRIINLRSVTRQVNQQNKRISRVPGRMIGVSYNKRLKKWNAQIGHNKNTIHIGTFKTEYEAHIAYVNKKRLIHAGCTI